jgi:hypothetical protein
MARGDVQRRVSECAGQPSPCGQRGVGPASQRNSSRSPRFIPRPAVRRGGRAAAAPESLIPVYRVTRSQSEATLSPRSALTRSKPRPQRIVSRRPRARTTSRPEPAEMRSWPAPPTSRSRPAAAREPVIAGVAELVVVPGLATLDVIAGAAGELVVPATTLHAGVALVAAQVIVTLMAVKLIVAAVAVQFVVGAVALGLVALVGALAIAADAGVVPRRIFAGIAALVVAAAAARELTRAFLSWLARLGRVPNPRGVDPLGFSRSDGCSSRPRTSPSRSTSGSCWRGCGRSRAVPRLRRHDRLGPVPRSRCPSRPQHRRRRARVRLTRSGRSDRNSLRQPVHLGAHDRGSHEQHERVGDHEPPWMRVVTRGHL